ncbi:hypothetical protein NC797_16320 [Aquibacillus sp. 3ASR75-11]|uniref:Uncharacterized protein n=1 Tax=Terrihalobacillus insolitus TaxID=2950438 RepID=A0A9X3WXN0_9BACI|nr:hypothetical protein [Terrihalobacillus insolitus]MDC3414511.1 hypothetical protein [Terrihalobacillus insolitus]MDC3426066.1 hypothetical protein [Terrihalobacillus insolitus]
MDEKNKKEFKKNEPDVKSYQELNEEISNNKNIKHMQPTPQPKDFEEIEY